MELQNHEGGHFVHIVHRTDTNCGASRVALLSQCWHRKEKIVDPHKHYNSSEKMTPNSKLGIE